MAELQFSGSRRDLAVEKGWVQLLRWLERVCMCVRWRECGGGGGGWVMEKGKNREKGKEESHVVFKNE